MAFLVSCSAEKDVNSKLDSINDNTVNLHTEHNLKLLTPKGGMLGSHYSYSADGCYEILKATSTNILYTDFASMKLMYLCSDMTMAEDDPANTSYIPNAYGLFVPIVTSKGLVILSNTTELIIKKLGDDGLAKIYISDYSGENRRVLYTLEAPEWIMDTSGIVEDGENLYFIEYYIEDEGNTERNYVVSVSMIDGKKQTIMELDAKTYIIGAYDDTLIMKKVIYPDKEKPWYEQMDNRENYIYKYNPYTGDTEEIISYKAGEKSIAFKDNKMVIINSKNNIVQIKDLRDNTSKNIDLTDIIDNGCNISWLSSVIYDNRIILRIVNENEEDSGRFLSVDITTEEWSYLDMYNGDSFCGIFAETEDEFMVTNGEYYYSYDFYMDDVLNTVDTRKPQFAMISKEDYWNNVPNLENIDYSMVYGN